MIPGTIGDNHNHNWHKCLGDDGSSACQKHHVQLSVAASNNSLTSAVKYRDDDDDGDYDVKM